MVDMSVVTGGGVMSMVSLTTMLSKAVLRFHSTPKTQK